MFALKLRLIGGLFDCNKGFKAKYLVLSDAALLLLLVVDSESELERGRRDSLLYTRKLSVTGWFPVSKPLLGKPESKRHRQESQCGTYK